MEKSKKVWRAEAREFWPQSNYQFRIGITVAEASNKKDQIELEVEDRLMIIRQEEKRIAFVAWLREISKVALEAAAMLEGLKVED